MAEFRSFIKEHIQDYIRYRKTSGSWHERSSDMISRLDLFLYRNYNHCNSSMTQEMIDCWCEKHAHEGANSWYNRIVCIKDFLCYYSGHTGIVLEVMALPVREDIRRIPYPFTKEELALFFHECDSHITKKGFPSRKIPAVLFRLLYSTGMRPIEARNLKTEDVDLSKGILSISMSKNGNARYIPVSEEIAVILRQYDQSIREDYPDREYFFPGRRGRLNCSWIDDSFRMLWSKNSSGHAIPYDFRHNFIIQNINSWVGIDCAFEDRILYLSRYVGHSNIHSTLYYYSLVPQFADILDKVSSASLDDIIPEVDYEG